MFEKVHDAMGTWWSGCSGSAVFVGQSVGGGVHVHATESGQVGVVDPLFDGSQLDLKTKNEVCTVSDLPLLRILL